MSPLGCRVLMAGPWPTHFHLLLVKERHTLDSTVVVECVWGNLLRGSMDGHPMTPAPCFSLGTHSSSALKALGKNPEVIKWGPHFKETSAQCDFLQYLVSSTSSVFFLVPHFLSLSSS